MIWAVYGALIAAFLAAAAGAAFLVVRGRDGWRAFVRLRREVFPELDRLSERLEAAAEAAERTTEATAKLDASLARLRATLAEFGVLRAALDEATDVLARFVVVYPRR